MHFLTCRNAILEEKCDKFMLLNIYVYDYIHEINLHPIIYNASDISINIKNKYQKLFNNIIIAKYGFVLKLTLKLSRSGPIKEYET